MQLFSLAMAALLAFAGPSRSRSDAPVEAARTDVQQVALRVEGMPQAGLASELALRVPDMRVVDHAALQPAEPGRASAFVDARRRDDSFAVTIVVSDGRAYDRKIRLDPDSTPDEDTRLLAGSIANLLFAIEAGQARADREDVAMPVVEPEPSAPVATTGPAEPGPCPRCPPSTAPEPPRARATIEVEPSFGLAAGIGLGQPRDTDRFIGAGGSLGAFVRHRTGAGAGLRARVLTRDDETELRIVRLQLAIGPGYGWRSSEVGHGFEVSGFAGFTVEPWWVRSPGGAVGFGPDRDPLLGGMLNVVPGYRFADPERSVAVRVGLGIELGISGLPSPFGRAVRVSRQVQEGPYRAFRAGGVEVLGQLEITVVVGVRR